MDMLRNFHLDWNYPRKFYSNDGLEMPPLMTIKRLRINNLIRVPDVQLIDANGEQLGIKKTHEAIAIAHASDLDLVEVGPSANPPIAKIMDYGKYLYQKERQESKTRSRQKDQEQKTVRVGFKTGIHDLNFKAKKADEFLGAGHLVKIELTLRGREKALGHMGREKLLAFLKILTVPYSMQDPPKRGPFGWVVMLRKAK